MLHLIFSCARGEARLAEDPGDEALVAGYVAKFAGTMFREPAGQLSFPYLVPGGYYQQE